jgi:hypothetical protein
MTALVVIETRPAQSSPLASCRMACENRGMRAGSVATS